jgi:hypothetical protein
MASEKGYSGGLYRFFTFLSWFICEVIGSVVGLLLFGDGLMVYVVALIGAILGYGLIYYITDNLEIKVMEDQHTVIDSIDGQL